MRRRLPLVMLFLCLFFSGITLVSPMTVHARTDDGFVIDSGDAVADIMNDQRFSGAISSIQWLTSRIDHWFTMAITAVAFFIISSALFKNVCAGAYCANHKFWDKVAEAHEKAEAISAASAMEFVKSKGFMNTTAGGLRDSILCIIPNIKAFTIFEDTEVSPKTYWMKAIPEMFACIIIGVFVYNGYYRDAASTVGNFGSEICERVFASVDPVVWVDKVTQTSKAPENIFENDASVQGEMCKEISKGIYKLYHSGVKELSDYELKCNLMRDCEKIAQSMTDEAASDFFSNDPTVEYTLSGLKVTFGGKAGQSTGFVGKQQVADENTTSPNGFTIDKNGDKYFMYRGMRPGTVGSYVTDSQQMFVVTGTLKMSKASGRETKTSIQAEAGTWVAQTTGPVCLALNDSDKPNSSNGVTTETKLCSLPDHIEDSSNSDYTAAIKKLLGDEYTVNSITVTAVNGWSQGTNAGAKKIKIQAGTPVNTNINTSLRITVLANITPTKGTNPQAKDATFTIPIQIKITK